MNEIVASIQALIAVGLAPRPIPEGLGACPRCGADIVEGREAFGCAKWDDGRAFRVPKEHHGAPIGRDQVRELAARGVVLVGTPSGAVELTNVASGRIGG